MIFSAIINNVIEIHLYNVTPMRLNVFLAIRSNLETCTVIGKIFIRLPISEFSVSLSYDSRKTGYQQLEDK